MTNAHIDNKDLNKQSKEMAKALKAGLKDKSGQNKSSTANKERTSAHRLKIQYFLKRIKNEGFRSVENDIPAEIKDLVLNACKKENISITAVGEKEIEAQQTRQAEIIANNLASVEKAQKPAPIDTVTLSDDRKEELSEQKKRVVNSATKALDKVSFAKTLNVESIDQTREDSRSVKTVMILNDGTTVETSGADYLQNMLKIKEAEELFTKKQNKENLSEQEEKRLALWAKKGILTLDDLKKDGTKYAGQISSKGMTGKYAEQIKEAKETEKETLQEDLLSAKNKETNLKLDQVKLVFEKSNNGISLTETEQALYNFSKKHIEKIEDLDRNNPENREKLSHILECQKHFMKNSDGTFFNALEQTKALKENPKAFEQQLSTGKFQMPIAKELTPIAIKNDMTIIEINNQARTAKRDGTLTSEDKQKIQLLNLWTKMNDTQTVDDKALAWAEENKEIANALSKKRGELQKANVSSNVFKAEIEKEVVIAKSKLPSTNQQQSQQQIETPSKKAKLQAIKDAHHEKVVKETPAKKGLSLQQKLQETAKNQSDKEVAKKQPSVATIAMQKKELDLSR